MPQRPEPDPFAHAMAAAAGHTSAASLSAAGRRWLPVAQRVRTARRRALEHGACPAPARRRVEALFAARPAPRTARWAQLVYDSWAGLAPALRGRSVKRLLEYRADGSVLYMQARPKGQEAVRFHFATDRAGVEFHVHLAAPGRPPVVVQADRHGVGSCELGPGEHAQTICVIEDGQEVFRAATPPSDG